MKRTLLAFCLLALVLVTCSPVQNALPPVVTPTYVSVTAPSAAIALPTATYAPSPAPMLTSSPTATVLATALLSSGTVESATSTPTWNSIAYTFNSQKTRVPLNVFSGKAIAFADDRRLRIAVPTGEQFEFSVNAKTIVVVQTTSQVGTASPMAATNNALPVLRQAVKDNASIQVQFSEAAPTVASGVIVILADQVAAALPTSTLSPSRPPVPTPTPPVLARWVEMPWGRVNLDPSIAETNNYAMSMWCYRNVSLVEAERVNLWATNPMGMLIGRPVGHAMLNVEVLSKDADWRTDSGEKYVRASVVARNSPDKSDTPRFTIRVFYNAPLAINAPVDERFDQNYKYWSIFMPVNERITDVNQIRVGQIYAIISGYQPGGWVPEIKQYDGALIKQGAYVLGLYSIPVPWLATCEFKQQQGWLK